jgi:hypothetical protein
VGTRRNKTGIGRKKSKESAECAVSRERQSSTWRNEREEEKGTRRNTE